VYCWYTPRFSGSLPDSNEFEVLELQGIAHTNHVTGEFFSLKTSGENTSLGSGFGSDDNPAFFDDDSRFCHDNISFLFLRTVFV